jgi:flagellar biosynthesis GTPase FlhF
MKVKTFTGATIDEALSLVKKAMGNSVLILETRTRTLQDALTHSPRKRVEVTVADDSTDEANSNPASVMGISRHRRRFSLHASEDPTVSRALPELPISPRTGLDLPLAEETTPAQRNSISSVRPAISPTGSPELASRRPTPPASLLNSVPAAQVPAVLQRIQNLNSRGMPSAAVTPQLFPEVVHTLGGYQPTHLHREGTLIPGDGAESRPVAPAHVPGEIGWTIDGLVPGRPGLATVPAPHVVTVAPPTNGHAPAPAAAPPAPAVPALHQALYEHLIEQDVSEPLARSILTQALETRGADASEESAAAWKQLLAQHVRVASIPDRKDRRMIQSSEEIHDLVKALEEASQTPAPIPASSTGPLLVAFVGPSGSGKTLAVTQMATHFAKQRKCSVGLIAIEASPAAGLAPLHLSGKRLGLPIKIVRTPAQFADAVKAFRHCTYVFIDTPACALQKEPGENGESRFTASQLQTFLNAVPGIEIHLVLSALMRLRDLRTAVDAFKPLQPQRLVVTRMDETTAFGHLFTLASETEIPLSYFLTGQAVPDHLEPATSERFVQRLLHH